MIRNLYRGGKPFLTLYIHVAIERGHDNYDFMIKEEIVHITRQFSLKKIPRNTLNIHWQGYGIVYQLGLLAT